jgi:transposase
MSGKRRKYTPAYREQAARLVIETGRPVAHVAAEIGVGEQVLGVGAPTTPSLIGQ